MHTTGISKAVSAEAEVDDIGGLETTDWRKRYYLPISTKSKRDCNFTIPNNPNFGRAVERERSELRNASPKERKSQVWKQKLIKKWKKKKLKILKN